MIPLPPGCRVNYPIVITVKDLTDEMVEWYQLIGGEVSNDRHWNYKGKLIDKKYVKYGKGKLCYFHQDGTESVRLHFQGEDASIASMFIIKFLDQIINHSMQEFYNERNQVF